MEIIVPNSTIEKLHTKTNFSKFIREQNPKLKRWYHEGYEYFNYITFLIFEYLKSIRPLALETSDKGDKDGMHIRAFAENGKFYIINYLNDYDNNRKMLLYNNTGWVANYSEFKKFTKENGDPFGDCWHLVENSYLNYIYIIKFTNLILFVFIL